MGCEDLYDIVASEETYLSSFSGDVIAIDSTFWFERYYNKIVIDRYPKEIRIVNGKYNISQLLSLIVSLPHLLQNNIVPVFFFDPMRRNSHPKSNAEIPYLEYSPTTSEPEKQFPFLQRPTELVLKYLDIDYCEAPLYAEADASKYAAEGIVDVVASNDYDTLLYGAPVTIRKKPYSSTWLKVDLEETLTQNEITYRELLDAAILAGTDEVQGPYKRHIEEAIEKIKKSNDLNDFEAKENDNLRAPSLKVSDDSPTFEELHNLYLDPPVSWENLDPSFPNPDLYTSANFLDKGLKLKDDIINDILSPIDSTL